MSDRENIEGIIKELEQQLASAQEESRQSESEEESKLLKAKTEETIKELQQLADNQEETAKQVYADTEQLINKLSTQGPISAATSTIDTLYLIRKLTPDAFE